MKKNNDAYEIVVGLEVHARLLTKSKLFSTESNSYGSLPNTEISPITLAHPGTLPKMNKKAIEFAVKMGLACHCEIVKENYFVRKNYFYPDLPKGYQVSQHTTPICKNGYIQFKTDGVEKKIRLNRIHIEEDAGKSLHLPDEATTLIDFNRAGTPLIEVVTEPDIRSGEEAYAFLTEIRKLVRYLEICDGNMEEGSLRCDANISVRKKGENKLGTKVEIKNLNSIRNVKRAIEFESERLIGKLEKGEIILQQTRSFVQKVTKDSFGDAGSGTTFSIREKEEAEDYRYFPEPDLTPFHLDDAFIENIRQTIPQLQAQKINRYISEYNLSEYDASLITEEKEFSNFFEEIIAHAPDHKAAANWMLGPLKSWMNENNKEIKNLSITPEKIAGMIEMINAGRISFSIASSRLFPYLLNNPGKEPEDAAMELNIIQRSDVSFIETLINEVLDKYPEKVEEYRKGKKGLLSLFVGEVMKASKGKADPKLTNQLLNEKLKS